VPSDTHPDHRFLFSGGTPAPTGDRADSRGHLGPTG
jgi:hypothetical protein